MAKMFLRHEKSPPQLRKYEFVGPQHQSTWIDPLSKSDIVHEGMTIEELDAEGYVSIYINLEDIGRKEI